VACGQLLRQPELLVGVGKAVQEEGPRDGKQLRNILGPEAFDGARASRR
jgi:hypothetical protein